MGFLLQNGFSASKADVSLFIKHWDNHILLVLIYVDDILVTGSDTGSIASLIQSMSSIFAVKDLGDLHHFLGLEVHRHSTGIFLSQRRYTMDLLRRAKMDGAKLISTPMSASCKLSKSSGGPIFDPLLFRSIVGALQYLTFTRPDIAFAVSKLCQFLHNPLSKHWMVAKRILRYLKGTLPFGLHFSPSDTLRLQAFSDADWAGCLDDRRSQSGFCIFMGHNLIS
ncbi:PREDICTED: uncharacterized protein LOC109114278 [Nelumbo nucifera]|uniref:Uncharacterized protein LOC109114278 n=1 Tax=Nelumbo nucifera TaxID=4432 RepID=A0A1U8Q2A7_NELNU|nr:PREDICTED: uncharacterized protein LOC109114278 [Nelumbo nucifera]